MDDGPVPVQDAGEAALLRRRGLKIHALAAAAGVVAALACWLA